MCSNCSGNYYSDFGDPDWSVPDQPGDSGHELRAPENHPPTNLNSAARASWRKSSGPGWRASGHAGQRMGDFAERDRQDRKPPDEESYEILVSAQRIIEFRVIDDKTFLSSEINTIKPTCTEDADNVAVKHSPPPSAKYYQTCNQASPALFSIVGKTLQPVRIIFILGYLMIIAYGAALVWRALR